MQKIKDKLYQGNLEDTIAWVDNPKHEQNIIIYLGQTIPNGLCHNCYPTFIHIPIRDGENTPSRVLNTILITHSIIENYKGKILIACRAGLSRSIIITISIYSLLEEISFDKAYKHVKKKCSNILPEQNLLREAKQVVDEINKLWM